MRQAAVYTHTDLLSHRGNDLDTHMPWDHGKHWVFLPFLPALFPSIHNYDHIVGNTFIRV